MRQQLEEAKKKADEEIIQQLEETKKKTQKDLEVAQKSLADQESNKQKLERSLKKLRQEVNLSVWNFHEIFLVR